MSSLLVCTFLLLALAAPARSQTNTQSSQSAQLQITEDLESKGTCELHGFFVCDSHGLFSLQGASGTCYFKWEGSWWERKLVNSTCTVVNGQHCIRFDLDTPAGPFGRKVRHFHFQTTPNANGKYPIYSQNIVGAYLFCEASKLFLAKE
jgi:hypothetical protein